MYKRARLGLGYLPQESSIFKGLSVEKYHGSPRNKYERQTRKEKRVGVTFR